MTYPNGRNELARESWIKAMEEERAYTDGWRAYAAEQADPNAINNRPSANSDREATLYVRWSVGYNDAREARGRG